MRSPRRRTTLRTAAAAVVAGAAAVLALPAGAAFADSPAVQDPQVDAPVNPQVDPGRRWGHGRRGRGGPRLRDAAPQPERPVLTRTAAA